MPLNALSGYISCNERSNCLAYHSHAKDFLKLPNPVSRKASKSEKSSGILLTSRKNFEKIEKVQQQKLEKKRLQEKKRLKRMKLQEQRRIEKEKKKLDKERKMFKPKGCQRKPSVRFKRPESSTPGNKILMQVGADFSLYIIVFVKKKKRNLKGQQQEKLKK